MPRVVAIKGLVSVKEIGFGDETGVDVAVFQVDDCLTIVLDVGDFFARSFADGAVKDEQLTMAEDHTAADES